MDAYSIDTGPLYLDGGAMFGVVPKSLWNRLIPADDKNRIRLAMRALLFRRVKDHAWCLVDCGAGARWDSRMADIYGLGFSDVRKGLQTVGVTPEDIAVMLATHLHFDHGGGLVTQREDGKLVPTFPNAEHVIRRQHWEYGLHPTPRDHASFRKEDFLPLEGQVPIRWLEEEETVLLDGQVVARTVHGHTHHLTVYDVHLPSSKVVLSFVSDVVPTAHHVRIPYVMGYDLQPLISMKNKTALYERTSNNPNHYLFLEHDADTECIRVRPCEKGWECDGPGCRLQTLLSGGT